jgi:hypothetical protein
VTDHNPVYADACERCGQYDVIPEAAVQDGADGMVAGYRCPNCRFTWTCGWGIVPGRLLPPEPSNDTDLFSRHLIGEIHEQAAINRARKHLARRKPDDDTAA